MANTTKFQTKNGLLTQNIDFVSPAGISTLHLTMLDSGTLSISGVSGQLFSVVDSLSGTIFGVNDISGIPSIEVDDTGVIRLAQYGGNILLGTRVDNGVDKLQIAGTLSANRYTSTIATGTAPFTVASTTRVVNLNVATAGTADTVVTNANLTGAVTSVGNVTTIPDASVLGRVLTGFTTGAGTVAATDSILTALQKLNGNDALNAPLTGTGASGTWGISITGNAATATNAATVTTNANLTGDVTSVGNATTLGNAPVIAKVLTGFTSVAGAISATDSILSALQKLNGNGTLKAPIASPSFTGGVTLSGTTTPLLLNGVAGTSGQVVTSAGPGATPTWATAPSGGGSGGSFTYTATGAIAALAPVAPTATGTVSAISKKYATNTSMRAGTYTQSQGARGIAYNPNNGVVVGTCAIYISGTTYYPYYGSSYIAGSALYGTAIFGNIATYITQTCAVCFDSTAQRFLFGYQNSTSYGMVQAANITTTAVIGTALSAFSGNFTDTVVANWPAIGGSITVACTATTISAVAIQIVAANNTCTSGAVLSVATGLTTTHIGLATGPSCANAFVVFTNTGSNIKLAVLSFSGTTLSVASTTTIFTGTFQSGGAPNIAVTPDGTSGVITWAQDSTTTVIVPFTCVGGIVTVGISITLPTSSAGTTALAYHSASGLYLLYYYSNTTSANDLAVITSNGTTVTASVLATVVTTYSGDYPTVSSYGSYVFMGNSSNYGNNIAYGSFTSTVTGCVGITASAIADTASGSVTLPGGVVTGFAGLTPGASYYSDFSGNLSTASSPWRVGRALTPTAMMVTL